MKKFNEFIKLNEKKENIINLLDINNVIKDVFNNTKVSSVKTVYEKDEETNEMKLIISINNLFYNKTDILHTKIVFFVDDKKTKLTKNKFFYLYDINCNFKEVIFNDTIELNDKLNEIIEKRIFGNNIKDLSDINISISSNVNTWFKENNVDDISIYNISYHPILDNVPCKSLSFKFIINVDDSSEIELRMKKNENNTYTFTFKENDWFYNVTISDIKGMVQTIGETLKKYFK